MNFILQEEIKFLYKWTCIKCYFFLIEKEHPGETPMVPTVTAAAAAAAAHHFSRVRLCVTP